jgi:hypothetical protein
MSLRQKKRWNVVAVRPEDTHMHESLATARPLRSRVLWE